MNDDQLEATGDLLHRQWTTGAKLPALPIELCPRTRAEGYRAQAVWERRSGRPLLGWKIAATSTAGQTHIGVDGPLAGRLLGECLIDDGGVCELENNLMGVVEVEFAFHLGGDVEPRRQPIEQAEVLARVDSLRPAIEIPDTRLENYQRAGLAPLIADNACANRFVLGPASRRWPHVDLASHPVQATVTSSAGGEATTASGNGANVLRDPRIALTWLANELSQQQIGLHAGQTVITGTCVVPIPIASGDHVVGDFGVFGSVAVTIG